VISENNWIDITNRHKLEFVAMPIDRPEMILGNPAATNYRDSDLTAYNWGVVLHLNSF
jgi:hypothetical protein